jgi:hypothetical protein
LVVSTCLTVVEHSVEVVVSIVPVRTTAVPGTSGIDQHGRASPPTVPKQTSVGSGGISIGMSMPPSSGVLPPTQSFELLPARSP